MKKYKSAESNNSDRAEFLRFIQIAIEHGLIPSDSSGFEPHIQNTVTTLRNITQRVEQSLTIEDRARRNQIILPIKQYAGQETKSTKDPTAVLAITIARIALTLNNQSYEIK